MIDLPIRLETQDDLDLVFNTFYSDEVQSTDQKHIRFGQFIFNHYSIEIENSYNMKDPYLAYGLILKYITHLKSYVYFLDGVKNGTIKLPEYLTQKR